jgi:membrane-bound lytic murein transglycosylase D
MINRLLNLMVFCLIGLPVWGQITSATPNVQEVNSVSKYLPKLDLDKLDSLPQLVQGMPSSYKIDPALIASRFAKIQNQIPLVYNEHTHQFVEYFAFKKAEFTRRMLERRDVYFPLYEKYLKQYNLPEELKYLSLIESGLETKAVSNKGAGGLWQFMPYTARGGFGLRVDGNVDERYDPEKATIAACKYLKQLYEIFGDWHLALAAYNTGPGNVKRAIRKCGKSDFWGIYECLPKETRAYVPKFIAMDYMMNYSWEHSIVADKWLKKIPVDTIQIKGFLNLTRFKKYAKIKSDTFQYVNPHLMSSTIPNDSRSVVIYIPTSNFEFFKANRQSILDSAGFNNQVQADSMATSVVEKLVKKRYKVKKGQTLYDVARILQVSVSDLKKLNRLRSNKIKKGKTLAYFVRVKQQVVASATVSGKDEADVEEAEPIVKKKSKKTKARYHKVRSGDTLSEIADRYPGLTVSKLKKLNHLRASSTLRLGMRLRIN